MAARTPKNKNSESNKENSGSSEPTDNGSANELFKNQGNDDPGDMSAGETTPPEDATPAAENSAEDLPPDEPLESQTLAAPENQKPEPMRSTVEKPICPVHFVELKQSSNQDSKSGTIYWSCPAEGCNHTDSTVQNGWALKHPVICQKERCRKANVAMEIDLPKTRLGGGQLLYFRCPACQHEDTRKGKPVVQMELVKRDLINRGR